MTNLPITTYRKQQGAALVVGLILLVAVTLMAIASMNTATLDLMMAANEQYHSRSFYAAETGIEEAISNDAAFDTSADFPESDATATGVGNDTYVFSVTRPAVGAFPAGTVFPVPSNNSNGKFGVVYFTINATGNSERGATTAVEQELFEVVRTSDEFNCIAAPCTL